MDAHSGSKKPRSYRWRASRALPEVSNALVSWPPRWGALEHVAAPSHINDMAELQLQSTITCPYCGHQATETMPANACLAFYDCKECGETLKPLPGSCCVFCFYGSVPCPPIQQGVEPCCDPLPRQSSRDWLGSKHPSLMAWWIPTALKRFRSRLGVVFDLEPKRPTRWLAARIL